MTGTVATIAGMGASTIAITPFVVLLVGLLLVVRYA